MNPQDVTAKPGESALFMVFGLLEGEAAETAVKELCANFAAIVRSLRTRYAELEPSAIMGFGARKVLGFENAAFIAGCQFLRHAHPQPCSAASGLIRSSISCFLSSS